MDLQQIEQQMNQQRLAHHGGIFPFGVAGVYQGKCENCGEETTVAAAPCRTAYHDQKLNTSPVLCVDCTAEYNEYWDDMWAEYYSGCL